MIFREEQTVALLRQVEDPEVREMAKNIALVSSLTKVLNSGLDVAGEIGKGKAAVGLALAGTAGEAAGFADQVSGGSAALKSASMISGMALSNKTLMVLSNLSPQKAAIALGLVTLQKVAIAGGMQEKYKCQVAIAALASTAGLALVTAPTGIGGVVAIIGTLAAGADMMNACSGPESKLKP